MLRTRGCPPALLVKSARARRRERNRADILSCTAECRAPAANGRQLYGSALPAACFVFWNTERRENHVYVSGWLHPRATRRCARRCSRHVPAKHHASQYAVCVRCCTAAQKPNWPRRA
ncbi:hypothetical protein MRX96_058581 [Rhipicephalus microplus]